MKITQVELFQVPPRWLFVKLTTDNGLSGWGEPVVEGRAATVATAVREIEASLIGQDPRRIEDIWQLLYRGGLYLGVRSSFGRSPGFLKRSGISRAASINCRSMSSWVVQLRTKCQYFSGFAACSA